MTALVYSLGSATTLSIWDLNRRHAITPTAAFNLTLPDLSESDFIEVLNVDGAFTITVKNSGGTTIATLAAAGDMASIQGTNSGALKTA